jgi:hypothetical protein
MRMRGRLCEGDTPVPVPGEAAKADAAPSRSTS